MKDTPKPPAVVWLDRFASQPTPIGLYAAEKTSLTRDDETLCFGPYVHLDQFMEELFTRSESYRDSINLAAIGFQALELAKELKGTTMKAKLEYKLPDEDWAFRVAVQSSEVMSGLLHLREQIRSRLKHGPEPDTAFVEEIYREINEIT